MAEKKKKEGDPDEAKKLGMEPSAVIDAKHALQKIAGKATLTEAVDAWLEFVEPFKNAPNVKDAIAVLVKDKRGQGNTPRHVREIETILERDLEGVLTKKVSHVTREELEKMRDAKDTTGKDPSDSLKRKRLKYANILVNYSIEKGWIEESHSPTRGILLPKKDVKPVRVLFVEEVAGLLWHTQERFPEMLSALAIKIFSGIRNSELYQLEWEWVKKDAIRVPAGYAKNRRTRNITMEPILKTWLSHAKKGKNLTGKVFNICSDSGDREGVWLEHLKAVYTDAGFDKWPQNALRHCFGSYHYQAKKNDHLTAFEMGNSPAVVRAHYVNAVDDEQATRFWNLTPGGVEAIATSPPTDPFAPAPQEPESKKWKRTPEDLEPDEIPVVHPTPTRTPKKTVKLPSKQEKKTGVLKPSTTTKSKFPVKRRLLEFEPPAGKKPLRKTPKRKK